MNDQRIITAGLPQLKALAGELALAAKKGDVFTLTGDLGAGKTEFARAFIRALMGEETTVSSPTFNILQIYEAATPIYHFDLYRIKHDGELIEIGLEDALTYGISLIEWPQIAIGMLPAAARHIEIKIIDDATRKIKIS